MSDSTTVTARVRRVEGGIRVEIDERLELSPLALMRLEEALSLWQRAAPRALMARCRAERSILDPLDYRCSTLAPDYRPNPCRIQIRSWLSIPRTHRAVDALVRDLLEVLDLVDGARSTPLS